jgi:hypothetical protein
MDLVEATNRHTQVLAQTLIGYFLEPLLRNCVRGILNKKQIVKFLISFINFFLPISKQNKNMQSIKKYLQNLLNTILKSSL